MMKKKTNIYLKRYMLYYTDRCMVNKVFFRYILNKSDVRDHYSFGMNRTKKTICFLKRLKGNVAQR